ncbi:hypothetical protein [Paenibacillus sp.]|jgi:hypothetical protein|uniref:hypothetical protein n=1 Tax=Paenibacillus sp. TaxID=58172 RepID=UPI00282227AF|nr:hypothetical protein [Paenibacillus sp.]MDR0269622.1 hypothetical protein [Paenibacillus sp.]
MNKRDWQADCELIAMCRYEPNLKNVNKTLDALVYWMDECAAEKDRADIAQLEAEKWRLDAFRKNPTQDAYDAACAALHKHRERADKAEQHSVELCKQILDTERREQKLKEALEHCIKQYPQWDSKEIAGTLMIDYMENVLSILYPDTKEDDTD